MVGGDTGGSSRTRRSSGGDVTPKKARKERLPLLPKWDIYDNPELLAYSGWKETTQPWTAMVAMTYVGLPHFGRMWPRECHEKHCKSRDGKYGQLQDLEVKWRFLTILRAISDHTRWLKNSIPKSIASMMYAEHVLKMKVDWSTLPSIGLF